MKSLKRSLCLVLALVMVLGMFGAASAFSDDAQIQYKEPVDVMVGIGAISGYPDGTFNPTGTVTRAEAAKMVAYAVLGSKVAGTLTGVTSSFTDVNANYAWAIPSIEYLVKQGVINGYPDGTFQPNGNITGFEIAKMLLCAAGYGKQGEYVGSGWELNVAIDANKYGVFAGSKATSYAVAATREESALYCFNALTKIEQVVWNKNTDNYVQADGGTGTVVDNSIGLSTYGLTVSTTITTDDFGRPANVWVAPKISTRPVAFALKGAPILTYTKAVTVGALKVAIANAGYTLGSTLNITRNGGDLNAYSTAVADSTPLGGNGIRLEVYGNPATGAITHVVAVVTYVGSVTNYKADVAATTTVDERTLTVATATMGTYTITSDTPNFDAVYTAALAAFNARKQLPVLITPAGDNSGSPALGALTIAIAEAATLTPTSYVTGTSFVADGKTYTYSATHDGTMVGGFTPVDVIFDAYGYVIYSAGTTTSANYAVVLALGTMQSGITSVPAAELLIADGTVVTVPVSGNTGPAAVGDIVTYTVSNGAYALTDAGATDVTSQLLSIRTGVSQFTWPGTYYANANTLFLVRSGSPGAFTYKAYQGIANVPTLGGTASGQVLHASSVAGIVYITNSVPVSATTDLIFIPSATAYDEINLPGGVKYYVVEALVNGTAKELSLSAAPVAGIYTSMVTADNGISTLGTAVATPAAKDISYAGGIFQIDTAYYAPTSDCVVFTYNATTGAVTASSLMAISATPANKTICYVLNSTNTQVAAIFIAE